MGGDLLASQPRVAIPRKLWHSLRGMAQPTQHSALQEELYRQVRSVICKQVTAVLGEFTAVLGQFGK